MYVCMYVCMHIYIYIHTYIIVCVYIYIYIHIYRQNPQGQRYQRGSNTRSVFNILNRKSGPRRWISALSKGSIRYREAMILGLENLTDHDHTLMRSCCRQRSNDDTFAVSPRVSRFLPRRLWISPCHIINSSKCTPDGVDHVSDEICKHTAT